METGLGVGPDGKPRCWWCLGSPDYLAYHDDEWGRPVTDERGLFERTTLDAFQSGLSWLTIPRKRNASRDASALRQKQRPDLAGRRGGSLRFEGAALDGGTSRPCGPSCSCRDEPGGMPARGEVSF